MNLKSAHENESALEVAGPGLLALRPFVASRCYGRITTEPSSPKQK